MPIEQATYLDTLEPAWPLGTDPAKDGDDHIRQIKQVLKNTFPAMNAPMNADPANINGITSHFNYVAGDGGGVYVDRMEAHNTEWTAAIAITAATPSPAQYAGNAAYVLTGSALQNMIYPVGHVLITARAGNPVDWLGFGAWTPIAGFIAGAGQMTDNRGYMQDIVRAHNPGYWRIANDQIIAAELGVTVDGVPDHTHTAPGFFVNNDTSTEGGGAATYGDTTDTTSPAGAHGHTARTWIGAGGGADGVVYHPPYTGYYVWERTA